MYVDEDDARHRETATRLTEVFTCHVGKTRKELQAELDAIEGHGTDYLLLRGFAKLLFDRCTFGAESDLDPSELRKTVFELAATGRVEGLSGRDDWRQEILVEASRSHDIRPEDVEANLYADLKNEQRLLSVDNLAPDALLHRYNTGLAQAIVLRAQSLRITISEQPARKYRELFRGIKFHQLLHRVEGNARTGFVITLDGPLSLFQASQKYGLQMASFLPFLLCFAGWSLVADVRWGKNRRACTFELSSDLGLKTHRRLKGQWQPEEFEWFVAQFEKLGSEWKIHTECPLLELDGQGVLVPDYSFEHESTGTTVYLELFGFWRRGAVRRRAELLGQHGPSHLIIGLAKELHAEKESLDDLPAKTYVFRTQPVARDVLKLLEGFLPS